MHRTMMGAELATCRLAFTLCLTILWAVDCTAAPRDPQQTRARPRRPGESINILILSRVPTSYRTTRGDRRLYETRKGRQRPRDPETQTTDTMVIGLLVLTSIPTVTGVAQGISAKKQENAKLKEKIKFNMTATLAIDGGPPKESWIVLAAGRVSGLISPVPA